MKQERISLRAMLGRLQSIEHYEDPQRAMDTLLYGFEKHTRRKGFARNVRYTGYLAARTAREFAYYCGYPIDQMA